MDALDRLRQANRYDLKLSNGILCSYRLPMMRELVLAGLISFQTLDQIAARLNAGGTETEAVSVAQEAMEERLADYGENFERQKRVVALMITALDGEPVTMQPEDALDIPQDDFNLLIAIALRAKTPGDAPGEA